MRVDGLRTAYEIRDRYRHEACGLVVHGPRGYGKSAFCVHAAAEALVPYMENPDYEEVKKWMIFTPHQFCDMVLKTNTKQMLLLWDDAGYWLNRLFWYTTFVKEALRYMTLARTQFTCVLFNTPSVRMLPNKILELDDVFRVKITKMFDNQNNPNTFPRLATVRSVWFDECTGKHGVRNEWSDKFSMFMPDSFFEWYEPLRNHYLDKAKILIRAALDKFNQQTKKYDDIFEHELGKTLAGPEEIKELSELSNSLTPSHVDAQ